MDGQKLASIAEELENLNWECRGKAVSALVELGPGRWFVRTFTDEGKLTDIPADQFFANWTGITVVDTPPLNSQGKQPDDDDEPHAPEPKFGIS